jgi:CO/xanthine dehydrogenase FAD-binding subunit
MIPGQFEYHAPKSIPDALGLLKKYGDAAQLLAGGHSLLPMMKLRFAVPAHLIDWPEEIQRLEARLGLKVKLPAAAASVAA